MSSTFESKKSPLIRLVPVEYEIGGQAAAEGAETLQEVLAAGLSPEPKLPRAFDMHFDLVARLKFERLGDSCWDSDGEAFAPFGDLHGELPGYISSALDILDENKVNDAVRFRV